MPNIPLEALSYGFTGFAVLLALLVVGILRAEGKRAGEPRVGLLRAAYAFMAFCVVLALLALFAPSASRSIDQAQLTAAKAAVEAKNEELLGLNRDLRELESLCTKQEQTLQMITDFVRPADAGADFNSIVHLKQLLIDQAALRSEAKRLGVQESNLGELAQKLEELRESRHAIELELSRLATAVLGIPDVQSADVTVVMKKITEVVMQRAADAERVRKLEVELVHERESAVLHRQALESGLARANDSVAELEVRVAEEQRQRQESSAALKAAEQRHAIEAEALRMQVASTCSALDALSTANMERSVAMETARLELERLHAQVEAQGESARRMQPMLALSARLESAASGEQRELSEVVQDAVYRYERFASVEQGAQRASQLDQQLGQWQERCAQAEADRELLRSALDECKNRAPSDVPCALCKGAKQLQQSCAACDSSGKREIKCGRCDGEGEKECDRCDATGSLTCGNCGGAGGAYCPYGPCWGCNGSGYLLCNVCRGNRLLTCTRCKGEGSLDCSNCDEGKLERTCDACDGLGNTTVSCPACAP